MNVTMKPFNTGRYWHNESSSWAPRWGQVGSENKDQTKPWALRRKQGIGSQSALRDGSGHLLPACRGRLCGPERMIPKTERWIGLTGTLLPPSDLEHAKGARQTPTSLFAQISPGASGLIRGEVQGQGDGQSLCPRGVPGHNHELS